MQTSLGASSVHHGCVCTALRERVSEHFSPQTITESAIRILTESDALRLTPLILETPQCRPEGSRDGALNVDPPVHRCRRGVAESDETLTAARRRNWGDKKLFHFTIVVILDTGAAKPVRMQPRVNSLTESTRPPALRFHSQVSAGYRAMSHIPGTHPDETSPRELADQRAVEELIEILRARVEAVDDLRKVFKRFDSDGNGRINGEELRAVISEAYHIEFTEKQFDILMKALDLDGDGTVDYVEFSRMLGEGTYRMLNNIHSSKVVPKHADDATAQRRSPTSREAGPRKSVVINESINQEHSAPRRSFIDKPPEDANEHEFKAYTVRLQRVLDMLRNKVKSLKSLRTTFRNFDEDKNGTINIPEFKNMIRTLNLDLSDDDIIEIIKFIDKDFNGVLDYQEFCDKFAAHWNRDDGKENAYKPVMPRSSVSKTVDNGVNSDYTGLSAEAAAEVAAREAEEEESLAQRDTGTAHVYSNLRKYPAARRLSHKAARRLESKAIGAGPRLADALCHGLTQLSLAPLLQQFRLADEGRSGFIPLNKFMHIISETMREMGMSSIPAHERYADLEADTDKHGYVDYITFYDRVSMASMHQVPDAEVVKPSFVRGARGVERGRNSPSWGGPSVNMDTLAGFRKPAYGRMVTVGHIPLDVAARGVRRDTLADGQFSRGGIAGYLSNGAGMEAPGMHRHGSMDRLAGGPSGLITSPDQERSMFSGGTSSSAVGRYAMPQYHGGNGAVRGDSAAYGRESYSSYGGGGVLQPALHRSGRHEHTKFPNTHHVTRAPHGAPAYGDDEQRYHGHAASGLIEDPHSGSSPRFPPGPKQQYTSRYQAKLERIRQNEERVRSSYDRADAIKEMYQENRLATSRQQRRRWRGEVNLNAEKMDESYGRDNFAVVRYGGPEAMTHVMSEVVGGTLPRPSYTPVPNIRHSQGTGRETGMKDFFRTRRKKSEFSLA